MPKLTKIEVPGTLLSFRDSAGNVTSLGLLPGNDSCVSHNGSVVCRMNNAQTVVYGRDLCKLIAKEMPSLNDARAKLAQRMIEQQRKRIERAEIKQAKLTKLHQAGLNIPHYRMNRAQLGFKAEIMGYKHGWVNVVYEACRARREAWIRKKGLTYDQFHSQR